MTAINTGIEVRRIGGRIGAEVTGIDLAAALPADLVAELGAALLAHKALFFRGQDLSDADHTRFAAHFGDLTGAHPTVPSVPGQPHVLPVDGEKGVRSNRWHTDVTFVPAPPKATSLRSLVVPPYGGDTLIANSAAAYEDLPGHLREFTDRLWAVHTNDYDYLQPPANEAVAEYRTAFASRTYRTTHPVVRVHPETGERGLFIGAFARSIVGLSTSESADILRILQEYVTRPENVVRWRWAPGDLVLFDNRITQHYAADDYGDLPRLLHRVTIAGDIPRGTNGESSRLLEGDEAVHYTNS
ncbi:TauD/TfdA dioxygenase family protein [Amycolatopsis pigmentata]|uniref:TauD/TfdA dioxygenase family protein n=1 Tax=Amycolatopsis pigmentata TaxID=450801 RepID=A0ABW5FKC8_9PSEU